MTNDTAIKSHEELREMVASTDTGGRSPNSNAVRKLIAATCIVWSIFQIYYASKLPFIFQNALHGIGFEGVNVIIDDTRARCLHLAFALFLAYLSYPARRSSPRHYIPVMDWILACLGAVLAVYYVIFYTQLLGRVGAPNLQDIICGCIGIGILLEATRRSLGLPLVIIAGIFLLYNYFGQFFPTDWIISHRSGSLSQIINQQWITSQGVFGVALGVSTKYVFPFVLFGALLDKAGAGNYFIKTAFAYLGHFRGGPAKAAVVASGLTGVISGSSIANVVTTGTFTIPMMKRVGFSKAKAGAVEVASSVNGQIMPPVMGAAAFLMSEYVNMPYNEIVKHAALPAIISYIALVYIVHLEACKQNMQGIPSPDAPNPILVTLLRLVSTILGIVILSFAVYYGLGWLTKAIPNYWLRTAVLGIILVITYILLLARAAQFPELEMDDPDKTIDLLPSKKPTVNAGLHFLLPVVILLWFLMVEKKSPGLSAAWGIFSLIAIQLTQRPLFAYFRKQGSIKAAICQGIRELSEGLETGARNMIGIGLATATAGIIVGVVAQTGFGSQLANIIEALSFGQLILILIWVAIFSLILGMGLPTTANYIVVSTLMVTVVVELGRQNGLVVPLIAVHMFVFYFGIMADVTPPVGLASFAAAAISGGDPIKTGLVAFFYSMRTALLPFLFIFNTDLLLIDVHSWLHGTLIFAAATIAMLAFTAATMGWFIDRCRWWETLLLLLVTAILFRPGFFMDYLSPSTRQITAQELEKEITALPEGSDIEFHLAGLNKFGKPIAFYAHVPTGKGSTTQERLDSMGIELAEKDGGIIIDSVAADSAAAKAGLDWDQKILDITLPKPDAFSKYWMYIPGIALLIFLAALQLGRAQRRRLPNQGDTA